MEPGTVSQPAAPGGAAKGKVVEGPDAIAMVIESAQRLGVELDEREARELERDALAEKVAVRIAERLATLMSAGG